MPSRLVVKNGSNTAAATSRIDAVAGVRKVTTKCPLSCANPIRNCAAVGHRLDRVGDHVDEAGADFFRIDVEHRRHRRRLLDHARSPWLFIFDSEIASTPSTSPRKIGRRRMDLDRLAVVEKALHQLREPPNLVLHQRDLTHVSYRYRASIAGARIWCATDRARG